MKPVTLHIMTLLFHLFESTEFCPETGDWINSLYEGSFVVKRYDYHVVSLVFLGKLLLPYVKIINDLGLTMERVALSHTLRS